MDMTTNPLTSASSKWAKEATAMTLLTISEIPVVEGKFADAINSWILQTKQSLAGFATAASELGSAAGESSDEESKLAAAPTLADIQVMGNRIEGDRKAGRDYSDKAKELKEMKAEHDRCKEELETSSTETQSQTECVSIPAFEGIGIDGEPQYVPPGEEDVDGGGLGDPTDPPGSKPGDKPGGTPNDPSKDRKLPEVTAKPTSSPSGESPSAPTLSDEPVTRLSSDSPTPSATPTTAQPPMSAQPSSSTGTPQQPSMPQVSMPQSQSPSGGQPQAQQAQQTPRGATSDDLRKRIQDAARKAEDEADKKADDAEGDTPAGDVGGAALVTGTATAGMPGAPTTPTVPGTPTTPGTPGTPPPGGVGGAPVGGAGAMGSGNAAQQKNANIISSQQPEPPLPTAPKVEGSRQGHDFDWNSDAVLPSFDGDTPKPKETP